MCFFKLEFEENSDLHTSQENGFSPVCVYMWSFKQEFNEKANPHISQENGFSPVCACMFLLIVEWSENVDSQTSSLAYFSICYHLWTMENDDQHSEETAFTGVSFASKLNSHNILINWILQGKEIALWDV